MRLFIGIKTDCKSYLCGLQQQLTKFGTGNFTNIDNLHITLKFLGEVPFSQLEGLHEAMDDLKASPFILSCTGVQIFNKSGIISAKVSGEIEKLQALQSALETALERIGYAKESRPFRPHITLVRQFKANEGFNPGVVNSEKVTFRVDEVILFESRRDAGKLVYAPLFVRRLNA